MTELYPVIDSRGELRGVIGTGGDATKICGLDNKCRYYLWLTTEDAIEVTSLLDKGGSIRIRTSEGLGIAPIASWVASTPYIHARIVYDLDDYVKWLSKQVGSSLKGKTVVAGFSGGKDSLATLIVLLKLMERIDFKLKVIYVHIPYLEAPRNIEFVEKVSKALGVEITIVSAPRRAMKTLLKWKGMPRRGYRYCTYYKAKPMREERKRDPRVIEVVADRLTESPKRFRRLSKAALEKQILVGRKFRPTYLLTILDVIDIVRQSKLIHPDYVDGLPRVACTLCPYKALYEFRRTPRLEDEELIEKVFKKMWEKWYSWTSYEVFKEQRLWRFNAIMAKSLLRVKNYLSTLNLPKLKGSDVEEIYRRLWVGKLPEAPYIDDPWKILEYLFKAINARVQIYVPS